MDVSQEYLKTVLNYNKDTGLFNYLKSFKNQYSNRKSSGGKTTNGYVFLVVDKKRYLAHRLAWLYEYGVWPANQIDHINGIRSDNRIENLRDTTQRENTQNFKCHRDGKLPGVRFKQGLKKPYQSSFELNGKKIHCGYFFTEEEAYIARLGKLKELGL